MVNASSIGGIFLFKTDTQSKGNTKRTIISIITLYYSAKKAGGYTHSTCIGADIVSRSSLLEIARLEC